MKKLLIILILISSFYFLLSFEPHFVDDPSLSPNGEIVVFAYKGDLWKVSAEGGDAERLTDNDSHEFNPHFSPNGEFIAFNSDRGGWIGLFVMPAEGGEAKPVSRERFIMIDWFSNGKEILTRRYTAGFGYKFYSMDLDGEYTELAGFAGYNADLNVDDSKIIFNRRGYSTRESYTGSVDGELWLYDIDQNSYNSLTDNELTETYPVFSADNKRIFFAGSDGNVFQLFEMNLDDTDNRNQLTDFSEWSVKHIDIARDKDILTFTLFDQLWIYDGIHNKKWKLDIDIKEDWIVDDLVKEDVANNVSNFTVSPNGSLLVFVYKFDLFAMPIKGGDVKQLTFDQPGIDDLYIASDNKTVFFSKYIDGIPELYKLEITEPDKISQVSWLKDMYFDKLYRKDNKVIVHYRDNKWTPYVAIADSLVANPFMLPDEYKISNDVIVEGDDLFFWTLQPGWIHQLFHYDIKSKKETRLLNFLGGSGSGFLNKTDNLLFYGRHGNIFTLDLAAKEDYYDEEDNWKEIVTLEKEDSTKTDIEANLEIDFEGIHLRQNPIITRTGYNWIVSAKDDSTFYYVNMYDDMVNLRHVNFKGENDVLIKTFKKDPKHLFYHEQDKKFFYTLNDRLYSLDPKSKKTKIINNKFKYQYDKMKLNSTVFDRVWAEFEEGFYNENMHGVDWDKSYKRFSAYLKYADDPTTLAKIVDEMIGEVNASHTGFYPRTEDTYKSFDQAYFGIELEESEGPQKEPIIKKIYRKSKFNKPYKIQPGSRLISVDGKKIADENGLVPLLVDKVNEKVELQIQNGDETETLVVKGLSYWKNITLYYDNWVEERRQKVEELSDGRIGYLHIRSMNNRSYDQFVQDLFAENIDKDALIIDVRNNGGGNIHDRLLEDLTRKPYGFTTSRFFDEQKVKTPSNIWDKPLVLLINENSFSDAEIFPNIFKFKKLGKIIGMPTSGSVIGTWHKTFMDGSSMRMPSSGWYLLDGTNMEGNGAQPDIYVKPTPEQIINDDDVQLKKAVEELLKDI